MPYYAKFNPNQVEFQYRRFKPITLVADNTSVINVVVEKNHCRNVNKRTKICYFKKFTTLTLRGGV